MIKRFYLNLIVFYILHPFSTYVITLIICMLFRVYFYNLMIIKESDIPVIGLNTPQLYLIKYDLKLSYNDLKDIVPKYNAQTYLHFYNTIHPDLYYTYIQPLLTESIESKLFRIASEKYHHAILDQQLFLMTQQNNFFMKLYAVYHLTSVALFIMPDNNLVTISIYGTLGIINLMFLYTVKLYFMDDELYLHLLHKNMKDYHAFIFNELSSLYQ